MLSLLGQAGGQLLAHAALVGQDKHRALCDRG